MEVVAGAAQAAAPLCTIDRSSAADRATIRRLLGQITRLVLSGASA
jgi:hypothetical protein